MRRSSVFSLFVLLFNVNVALASFCGQSSIPFSFEALPNGQPVLGCARPTCFGWTADGRAASPPATFYRVNKKPDGYFRKDAENLRPRALSAENIENFRVQTAECSATFDSQQCPSEKNYWVGGIAPNTNITRNQLSMQCCQYRMLELSIDRGIAVVNPGQVVFGGEVLNDKRQYAFDYISDIAKHVKNDGTVSYEVSVRRLTCLPYPPEFAVLVEPSVSEELIRRFSNLRKGGKSKAFQAPTIIGNGVVDSSVAGGQSASDNTIIGTAENTILEPAGERVDVIEGPFVAENDAVVGEVPAEQGFELPPGQVPDGLIQQPVDVQPQAPLQAPGYGYGTYSSGSYGSAGSAGSAGSRGFFCFTADTMVQLSGGHQKRMDELSVGDWVMTEVNSKIGYSKVKSWIHRMPEKLTQFHKIELNDGKVLKLTGKHFIYRTQCLSEDGRERLATKIASKPVFAEDVQIGDCLYVRNEKKLMEVRVRDVSIVEEMGIYSPMTYNGKIIVNDVLASCFNIIDNHTMQDTFFTYVKSLREISVLNWLFGAGTDNMLDLPVGIGLLVDLLDYAVPTNSQLTL